MSDGLFQRKRLREDVDDIDGQGIEEHKPKRQFQNHLAIRRSPENKYHSQLSIHISNPQANIPAPPTITPADSDCDEAPKVTYTDTSVWSPDSSFMGSPYPEYAQAMHSSTSQNSLAYLDDHEMADHMLLSPGPFQADRAQTLSDRIPTPMNPHFGHMMPGPQANHMAHNMDIGGLEDAHVTYSRRRLPSPISEDEPSPSTVLEGVGDIHMEVEMSTPPQEVVKESPPKKGHRRSPYGFNNLANWTVNHGMAGAGEQKKTFSMGYRSDCDKCRDRVPGHFSHIIPS